MAFRGWLFPAILYWFRTDKHCLYIIGLGCNELARQWKPGVKNHDKTFAGYDRRNTRFAGYKRVVFWSSIWRHGMVFWSLWRSDRNRLVPLSPIFIPIKKVSLRNGSLLVAHVQSHPGEVCIFLHPRRLKQYGQVSFLFKMYGERVSTNFYPGPCFKEFSTDCSNRAMFKSVQFFSQSSVQIMCQEGKG